MKSSLPTALPWLVIVALLCVAAASHSADVYKWKNGKVVTYSQLPPAAGVQAQRIRATASSSAVVTTTSPTSPAQNAAPAAPDSTDAPNKTSAKGELTPEQQKLKDQLAKDADTKLVALARRRADQCTRAHGQFDELTQHARLRVQDDKGNWKILDDSERKHKLDEVQERIVEFCS